MTHLEPDLLALLALGEDAASPEQRAHLTACPECAGELRRLQRTVAAGRGLDGVPPLETPAPRVWAGIAEELGLPAGAEPSQAVARPAAVVPLRPGAGSGRRIVLAAAAAAVVLLVGGLGVVLLRSATDPIASARLVPFPDWQGESGTAVLERRPDGGQVVDVHTSVRPDGRTDHEVWLMTPGAKRLVSLGMLHGTSGRFAVPTGLDVHRFRFVDVSDEPRDGDPAHSGDSIIRGALRF
jgi:anti-sigma-K factor RskA